MDSRGGCAICVEVMPSPLHNASVARTSREMVRIAGDRAFVLILTTVRRNEWNEFASRHLGPKDILLVVEVADSSLKFDKGTKARLKAETGVLEYRIADIPNDSVFAYSDNREGSYRTVRQYRRGDTITPVLLPGSTIAVDHILP